MAGSSASNSLSNSASGINGATGVFNFRSQMEELSGIDLDLWTAANNGDVEGVKDALQGGANAECVQPARRGNLKYKGRRITTQPLHAAAMCQGQGESLDEDGWPQATAIVRILLEHKANAEDEAYSEQNVKGVIEKRSLQAIHMAAGSGNAGVIELLVQHGASADAEATIQKNPQDPLCKHYQPVHDAVWFGHVNSLRRLQGLSADLHARNNFKDTALHLAAKLGHVEIVEVLCDAFSQGHKLRRQSVATSMNLTLLKESNKNVNGDTPLDVAVKGGLFPLSKLHLFTSQLSDKARVEAFVTMATICPQAAASLLLSSDDDGMGVEDIGRMSHGDSIDEAWRRSFQFGASEGQITPKILANLLECAPAAAVYLLEALTDTPTVADKGHNPLPIRAWIPRGSSHPIACEYVDELEWTWNPHRRSGRQTWHSRLAVMDHRRGNEVKVKVTNLQGIENVDVLHRLAETEDYEIFTKIPIHALLQHCFGRLRLIFVTDFMLEILTTLIISNWILGHHVRENATTTELVIWRMAWCVVASYGLCELLLLGWTIFECLRNLSPRRTLAFAVSFLNVCRMVLGTLTIVLALLVDKEHGVTNWAEGDRNGVKSRILATTILLHWLHLLYQLRVFQSTGQRLLPIIKSVQPISGMLVIMLFLLLGFVHAFWSLRWSNYGWNNDGILMFEVAMLLFTGEGFLLEEEIAKWPSGMRVYILGLTMLAVFIFMACALNVFIAVLGDCYKWEQERTMCTFLKERAKVCSTLFMRPRWEALFARKGMAESFYESHGAEDAPESMSIKPGHKKWLFVKDFLLKYEGRIMRCCVSTTVVTGFFILLFLSTQMPRIGETLTKGAAVYLCFSTLLCHTWLRSTLTNDYDKKYLWMCYESRVEESMRLVEEKCGEEQAGGQVGRIKRFVDEQCSTLSKQCQALSLILRARAGTDGMDSLDVRRGAQRRQQNSDADAGLLELLQKRLDESKERCRTLEQEHRTLALAKQAAEVREAKAEGARIATEQRCRELEEKWEAALRLQACSHQLCL